jgi:hypothetical protein
MHVNTTHKTGLDSTAATSLIQTLRRLATEQGKTIVAVIHQPSQHVFAQFDDLLLVSEGQQMYFGALDQVRSYMEQQLGYPALAEMGTAEHVLDCISRRPIGNETQPQADERMRILADAAAAATEAAVATSRKIGNRGNQQQPQQRLAVITHTGPRAGLWTQFQLLLQRSLRELARGKTTLLIKLAQQVALAVIYGVCQTLLFISFFSVASGNNQHSHTLSRRCLVPFTAQSTRRVSSRHYNAHDRESTPWATHKLVFKIDSGCYL